MEEALQESEERYRTLLASAPMAVFVCDRNAVIQHYNRHAVQLWGREPVCQVERHCGSVKLWLPDGTPLPHAQSPMVDVLRTGTPILNVEVLIERPDGSRLPVLVNFAALKNARGETTGGITSFIDISERKRAEASMRQSTGQYETLLNEQQQTANHLRRLAADLSEADRRKDEFLAMLAHELRNPLAPISNALRIMQHKSDDQEVVLSASAMMERQIEQMTRLVDDLLDVSRITRGKIELRKEQVELTSLANQAVEATSSHFQCMDHKLTVEFPPEPVQVTADPLRLTQVIGNLLTNACKFTDKEGVISLLIARESDQGVIRVRDNGIGIAADQLPHIFDLFMQIDTTIERSTGGLGIGLTLVKNLVEMHGGAVEAHSAGLGCGSEFVVRLPVFMERRTQARAEPYVGESTKPGRRILIVDDNRDAAESLAMLLNLTGHETRIAYDGLEAVAAAEAFKPDAALLDIGLPSLNGYEVARKIRECAWGKDILLIAITGWGQDGERRKSADAGFDAHLVKPADFGALQKLLATTEKR